MYRYNLSILLEACVDDDELRDALFDYFVENEIDLNNVNIEDIVANNISFIDKEEVEDFFGDILVETEDGAWVWD